MTNEIAKKQMCVLMRSGIEIWIDKDKADKLRKILINSKRNLFIDFEERSFNTADITGVFIPQDLVDLKRRKNGQYKCSFGTWHDKGEFCGCKANRDRIEDIKRTKELVNNN